MFLAPRESQYLIPISPASCHAQISDGIRIQRRCSIPIRFTFTLAHHKHKGLAFIYCYFFIYLFIQHWVCTIKSQYFWVIQISKSAYWVKAALHVITMIFSNCCFNLSVFYLLFHCARTIQSGLILLWLKKWMQSFSASANIFKKNPSFIHLCCSNFSSFFLESLSLSSCTLQPSNLSRFKYQCFHS